MVEHVQRESLLARLQMCPLEVGEPGDKLEARATDEQDRPRGPQIFELLAGHPIDCTDSLVRAVLLAHCQEVHAGDDADGVCSQIRARFGGADPGTSSAGV